jgi:hypothetical protein
MSINTKYNTGIWNTFDSLGVPAGPRGELNAGKKKSSIKRPTVIRGAFSSFWISSLTCR